MKIFNRAPVDQELETTRPPIDIQYLAITGLIGVWSLGFSTLYVLDWLKSDEERAKAALYNEQVMANVRKDGLAPVDKDIRPSLSLNLGNCVLNDVSFIAFRDAEGNIIDTTSYSFSLAYNPSTMFTVNNSEQLENILGKEPCITLAQHTPLQP